MNLHEAFWTDDQCLIVMDLAHGGNLFDKLHKDIMDCQRDPFPGLGGKEFSSKHVAAQLLLGEKDFQAMMRDACKLPFGSVSCAVIATPSHHFAN